MFPRQCWSFGHKLQDWSKLGNSRKIVTNPEVQLLQFQSWITLETPTSSDSRTGKPLGFNPRQWSTNTVGFCFVYVKHGWNYWWVNILPNRARYHLFWSSNLQDISKTHPRRHLSLWEELLDERKQHGFPAKIRFSKRVTASRVLNFDSSAGSATWQIQMLVIPGDLWNPLNLFQNVTQWWNLWRGQVASSLLYSIVFFFGNVIFLWADILTYLIATRVVGTSMRKLRKNHGSVDQNDLPRCPPKVPYSTKKQKQNKTTLSLQQFRGLGP